MTDLPYRPCVGIALANARGEVFIGRRKAKGGGEILDALAWQMPQGGIDEGEAPLDAARRELHEETNVRSATLIAEHPDWLSYDLPPEALGPRWIGRYRGQTQKWLLFRFTGEESEIDIEHPPEGEKPEFDAWRWERLDRLPDLIVPFKRPVYEKVAAAFAPLAGRSAR